MERWFPMREYKRAAHDTVWAVLIQKPKQPSKPVQPIDTRTPSGRPLPY